MTTSHSTLFLITLDLAMVVYTLWILGRAAVPGRLRFGLGLGALGWLVALHLVLSHRRLLPETVPGPIFLALVVGWVAVVGLVLAATPIRRELPRLGHRTLLLPQGIRVFFGAGFLLQTIFGHLPTPFGILDGFSHIGAGFLALLAAASLSGAKDWERGERLLVWLANGFGLLDILVVASTLSLVLLPELTPFHPMMYAVFLPAPIWLWLHLVAIARLLRGRSAEQC